MCVCVCLCAAYLYKAQRVIELFACFLPLFLLFVLLLLLCAGILHAGVVDAEAEKDLHVPKSIVEVAEAHLVETCEGEAAHAQET